ncbi:MAG: hypothetical protein NUW37_06300 [Planctomycetes bacterium]|nr:hypothetical protein [Planctomycetota bacterium]
MKITRSGLLLLTWIVVLTFAFAPSSRAESRERVSLKWELEKNDVVVYRTYKITGADIVSNVEKDISRLYSVYGYDLSDTGAGIVYKTYSLAEASLAVVCKLPDRPAREGDRYEAGFEFAEIEDVAPFGARARYEFLGEIERPERPGAKYLGIKGVAAFSHSGRNPNGSSEQVEGGQMEFEVFFNPREQIVHSLVWNVRIKLKRTSNQGEREYIAHDRLVRMKKFSYRYPEFQAEVDTAIDGSSDDSVKGGVDFIIAGRKDDGTFLPYSNYKTGLTALCLLTLIKSGVSAQDPDIIKGMNWLLAQPFEHTYEVGISILALEAFYTPPTEEYMMEQGLVDDYVRALTPRDRRWMQDAVHWLVETDIQEGYWGYGYEPMAETAPADARTPGPVTGAPQNQPEQPALPGAAVRLPNMNAEAHGGSPDHSNSQYALLGLSAASRCGIEVPASEWTEYLEYYIGAQEPRGERITMPLPADGVRGDADPRQTSARGIGQAQSRGFGYRTMNTASGSMTAAGIAGLALPFYELRDRQMLNPQLRGQADQSLRDAVAWMYKNWDVRRNPGGSSSWYYYYLYGIERACVLADVFWVGDHDWYFEGAMQLIKSQFEDGSWRVGPTGSKESNLVNTCFALLFLKRATTRPRSPQSGH